MENPPYIKLNIMMLQTSNMGRWRIRKSTLRLKKDLLDVMAKHKYYIPYKK